MQPRWTDGRPTAEVVAEFIKPNDRLTSFERLELYNRQYWFRLIDVMYEDYAGLAAILGRLAFNRFCEAYLTRHPSRSGLLRYLGREIVNFIDEQPTLTAPYTEMARDMARFEWAQVEAFDAESRPPLTIDDLLGKDPAQTRLTLQRYVSLLDLNYAVDHLLLAVKKQPTRSEASNATDGISHGPRRRRSAKAEKVRLVVHRLNNVVYLKRLVPEAFAILTALASGATIAEAVQCGTPDDANAAAWAGQVGQWFKDWMSFGWFCHPSPHA